MNEGSDSTYLHGSYRRDYPTFQPEESSYRGNKTQNAIQKSMIFPQKLDLSMMEHFETPKKAQKTLNKKKISPIKASNDSKIDKNINFTVNSTKCEEKLNKTFDLEMMRRDYDECATNILNQSIRKGSGSSVTSDRGSSISSSSGTSLGQKSIFVQVSRAKQLIDRRKKEEIRGGRGREKTAFGGEKQRRRNDVDDVYSDSDFHLTTDDDDQDTRPPSSQASLAFEVEQPRRAAGSSNVVSSEKVQKTLTSSNRIKESGARNAATDSDSVRRTDETLIEMYKRRQAAQQQQQQQQQQHYSDEEERTLAEHRCSDDADRTIVDEVFEDFRPSSPVETPILRSYGRGNVSSPGSLGSVRIERARDAAVRSSQSMNNIMSSSARRTRFDGIAPGALHHSLSVIQVSPQKLRELQKETNYPIPSLARFAIKPSTRNIFPLPLDIDAISGKCLRRDEKSTQRNFGGKAASVQIHGEKPEPRKVTISQKPTGANRPTTASSAKIREFSTQKSSFPTQKLDFPAKKVDFLTKNSNSRRQPPPYCSSTTSDGTAYSISTVTQQLLGTVKSLHPDWLQMIRRLLNDTTCDDVANEFRALLLSEKEHLEQKFQKNQNSNPFEEHTDHKISAISRILDRLEELGPGGGGHISRVQQIKMIHSALLST